MTDHPGLSEQRALEASANRRELVALLRREGRHSGVWFGDKLTEAADLIQDLAGAAFAQPPASVVDQEAVQAKPLFWRKGTDHPQDGEAEWVADGISGRYSASKQRDGTWLLWWAHDNFIWEKCATFAECKAKAEADWQARFAERIAK